MKNETFIFVIIKQFNYLQKRVEWRGVVPFVENGTQKRRRTSNMHRHGQVPFNVPTFLLEPSSLIAPFLYSKAPHLKPSVETILHHCGSLNTSVVFTRNWKSEFLGRRSEDEGSRNLKFCGKGASFLKDSQSIKFIVLPLLLVLLCSPLSAIWQ